MEEQTGRATPRGRGRRTATVVATVLALVVTVLLGASPGTAASGQDRLLAGETLEPGQALVSPSGTQTLVVQPDGDLGLYDAQGLARWAAGAHVPGAHLTVTADGDVTLVAPDGTTTWSTGTADAPGAALVVRDDGDVVVEAPDGTAVWESGTAVRPSILLPGEELEPGEALTSPDGRHTLLVLDDGDVVLLGPDASTRWSAGTHEPGSTLDLHEDGNLVVTDPDGRWEWRTRTAGHPGASLSVQDDGNVVLYAVDGTVLWSTRTPIGPARLDVGTPLTPGQDLGSPDGRLRLRLGDAGLALTYDDRPVWSAPVDATAGARLDVRDDGDLVLAAADGTPLWSTGTTTGGPGASLRIEDGAVLLLAATGQELWRVDVPAELLVRRTELAADCTLVDAPVPQADTVVTSTGVRVHPCLAGAVDELVLAARAAGIDLHAWGWRSGEQQVALRAKNCHASPTDPAVVTCHPPTAVPGTSRHERGLALDFTEGGRVVQAGSPAFAWLVANAPAYGLTNLPSEAWHWSVDGW